MNHTFGTLALATCIGTLALGCESKPDKPLAPAASALAPAEKPSEKAVTLDVATEGSKVTFLMNAPLEKISGEVIDGTKGEIFIDLMDVTKTTALIKVDLDKLTLYQQKREDEKSEYGERAKNDTQNEHARAWLEISKDAPEDVREKNRWVEFKIDKLVEPSAQDITKLTGAERKITAWASGELRLHGRKTEKRAKVEATFKYEGDKLASVHVKTLEPMKVGLEEHDVRPREAFGKLAQKTLSALGSKVATEAPIEIELTAKPK